MDSGGIGSRQENRSPSHDPYTFECQCQSRETGSHFLPLLLETNGNLRPKQFTKNLAHSFRKGERAF